MDAPVHAVQVSADVAAIDKLFNHYLNWIRLKRAVAVYLRVTRILSGHVQQLPVSLIPLQKMLQPGQFREHIIGLTLLQSGV